MRTRMSRREALAALLGGSTALLAVPKAHSVRLSTVRGCLIETAHLKALQRRGVSFFQPGERLITTTGDRVLDRFLGRALVRLSGIFSERPGFGFVDDSDAPNAYATDHTQVQGTWGTVCFGRTLFRDLMDRYQDQGLAVMAVAAHEFGTYRAVSFRRRPGVAQKSAHGKACGASCGFPFRLFSWREETSTTFDQRLGGRAHAVSNRRL